MNTAQLIELNDEFNTNLNDLHTRFAYQHAMENLGLSPEDALVYAEESANAVIDTGDDN